MIPAAIAVFVCTVAVDLRASFDRLAAPPPAASPAARAGLAVDAGRDEMITELWRGLAHASVSA